MSGSVSYWVWTGPRWTSAPRVRRPGDPGGTRPGALCESTREGLNPSFKHASNLPAARTFHPSYVLLFRNEGATGKIGELSRESGKEQKRATKRTPNVSSNSAPSGRSIYPPWRSVAFTHL